MTQRIGSRCQTSVRRVRRVRPVSDTSDGRSGRRGSSGWLWTGEGWLWRARTCRRAPDAGSPLRWSRTLAHPTFEEPLFRPASCVLLPPSTTLSRLSLLKPSAVYRSVRRSVSPGIRRRFVLQPATHSLARTRRSSLTNSLRLPGPPKLACLRPARAARGNVGREGNLSRARLKKNSHVDHVIAVTSPKQDPAASRETITRHSQKQKTRP